MGFRSWLFGEDEFEDELPERRKEEDFIDPILEERRKEKFNKPLILDDDEKDMYEKEEPVQEEVKQPEPKPLPKPKQAVKQERRSSYQMSQVISPIYGVQETKTEGISPVEQRSAKAKVYKKQDDALIPVMSPFFGPEEEEEPAQPVEKAKKPKRMRKPKPVAAEEEPKKATADDLKPVNNAGASIETVEDRLRNIASLAEESQNDLKIVEERTGEFKLDLKKKDDSLIDAIDDNLSLEELMSLYEKKFKD